MITVKDSGNNVVQLKTTKVGSEHIPHHVVESSALPAGAATQATLAAILADLLLKADKTENQPVTLAGLGGAATEATLSSALTALGNILTDLQLKADKTENQPVELADLGAAATEATLTSLLGILTQLHNLIDGGTGLLRAYATPAATDHGTFILSTAYTDNSAHELVATSVSARLITQLVVGNSSDTPTWVHVRNDSANVYSVYAPAKSSVVYEPSKFARVTIIANNSIDIQCETTGANVIVGLSYCNA